MEEDKYSLLYPNEDEKNKLLYQSYNDEESKARKKIVVLISVVATESSKELAKLYHDELVVAALKEKKIAIINDKTNPIIVTFPETEAENALLTIKELFESIREFNSDKEESAICELQAALHFGEVLEIENDIMGEVINISTKVHSVTKNNLILLSKSMYELLHSLKHKCFFIGGFHFKGSIEPTQIFGYYWLDDSDWLLSLYQDHMDVLLIGDPNRYRIIQTKFDEKTIFKPLAPLYIETIPTGAQVWLDEIPIHQHTPFQINHKIGEFDLRIVKKGYKTIQQTIQIQPNTENEISLQMKSIMCSIKIESEEPDLTIIFNGKELKQKTPHKISQLMPAAYLIELRGDNHYSNPHEIVLQEAEHTIYNPTMLPYGKLVILSRIKDMDFMLKDAVSEEKIKINEDKFTYSPSRQYQQGITDEMYLKEGSYIIEPLDDKYQGVKVEIKSGESVIFDYDEHVEKKAIIIRTDKYESKVSYKHDKTGEKGSLSIKGKKKITFLPGKVKIKIEHKLATREYDIDLHQEDVSIQFSKDIHPTIKRHKAKILKKSLGILTILALLFLTFYSYFSYENKLWNSVMSKNDLASYHNYLDKFYLFLHRKTALEKVANSEESLWASCQKIDSADSYEQYLELYSSPKFNQEAQLKHEQLLWNKAISENQPELYKKFIDWHPHSKHTSKADSLFEISLWERYKQKNSMIHFSIYLWKYPASEFYSEAVELRENVFYSMAKPDFWLDKWQDIKTFIISPATNRIKLIIMGILLLWMLRIYLKKRSIKVK